MTRGRENQRAVDVDRQYQRVTMKGSWPVLFSILLCLQAMAPEKAAERRSFHPEMEMKVGEEDLGHHGSNSSNSRRKEKWFCEEEMEWRRKKSKEKKKQPGNRPENL